jgi:hypothetical protein
MPPAAFRARLRRYAFWGGLGLFRAFADQVRRPTVAVPWPERALFALRLVLEFPFMMAFLLWIRPGQLRAQHEAERLREASPR